MSINSKRGFTLIELLVVIAIIGILASVVLASLNSARSRGADAAIKSNLSNIRAQAEIQYDSLGCYAESGACNATTPAVHTAGTCPTAGSTIFRHPNIISQIAGASSASGSFVSCASTVGGGAWAVAVVLKSNPQQAWCVDSTGASKQISHTANYDQAALNGDITGGVCGT